MEAASPYCAPVHPARQLEQLLVKGVLHMRAGRRSLTWRGQAFRFQRLSSDPQADALWSDFDLRGTRWLAELLSAPAF
jgi:hypothetical protein